MDSQNGLKLLDLIVLENSADTGQAAPIRVSHMSHVMRKPGFCICENKGADQLCGKHVADQRLCFRNIDSTIPLLCFFFVFIVV